MAEITDKQFNFIKKLAEQKDTTSLSEMQLAYLGHDDGLRSFNTSQASRVIKVLLALPDKPKPKVVNVPAGMQNTANTATDIEPGYYFVVDPSDDKEKFFRVSKGKEGTRWEGYRFLSVQASDYFYPIRDNRHREIVFEAISIDPIDSMNQYGIRLGRCGVCNRILTDRDSRLRGIGPICAARLHNPTTLQEDDIINQLRMLK
jgi:hypothetical protein